jgi:hypothetical protein
MDETILNIVSKDLKQLADHFKIDYQGATPFPNIIIDDFFDHAFLDNCYL